MPYTKKSKKKKSISSKVKSMTGDPVNYIPVKGTKTLSRGQLNSYGKYLKSKKRSKI
jgi:hypothetical protein